MPAIELEEVTMMDVSDDLLEGLFTSTICQEQCGAFTIPYCR